MSFWNKKRDVASVVQIEDKLVSSELKDEMFVCDLSRCKGACCVEGDLGAPLEGEEPDILEEIFPKIQSYLRPEGLEEIEAQGTSIIDITGGHSTPLVKGRECAYVTFSEEGIAGCAIEQAHTDGVIDWKKPVSCHLYPVRITELKDYDALNYDRWGICSAACSLGDELGVPVYRFVKDALIRKYGEEFYEELEAVFAGMDDV